VLDRCTALARGPARAVATRLDRGSSKSDTEIGIR
jgi:hypothetical protein